MKLACEIVRYVCWFLLIKKNVYFSEFLNVKINTLMYCIFHKIWLSASNSLKLSFSIIHDWTLWIRSFYFCGVIDIVSEVYRTFTDTLRKVKIDSLP